MSTMSLGTRDTCEGLAPVAAAQRGALLWGPLGAGYGSCPLFCETGGFTTAGPLRPWVPQ